MFQDETGPDVTVPSHLSPDAIVTLLAEGATSSCMVSFTDDGQLQTRDADQELVTNLKQALDGRAVDPFVAFVSPQRQVAVLSALGSRKRKADAVQDGPFKKPKPLDSRTMIGKLLQRAAKEILSSQFDTRDDFEEDVLSDDEDVQEDHEPPRQLPMTESRGLPFQPFVVTFYIEGCVIECDPPKNCPRTQFDLYTHLHNKIVQFFSANHFVVPTKYSVAINGFDDVACSLTLIQASTPVERKVVSPKSVCNFSIDGSGAVTAVAYPTKEFCRVRHVPGAPQTFHLFKPLPKELVNTDVYFCENWVCFTTLDRTTFVTNGFQTLQIDMTPHEHFVGMHVVSGEAIVVVGDVDNDMTTFRLVTFSPAGCEERVVFRCSGCSTGSASHGSKIYVLLPDDSVVLTVSKSEQRWRVEDTVRVCHPNKPTERLLYLAANTKHLCVVTRTAAVFVNRETGTMSHFTNIQKVNGVSGFRDNGWLASTAEGLVEWHFSQ